jgi:hypothetical protein
MLLREKISILKPILSKSALNQATKPYMSSFINAPTAWGAGQTILQGEARSSNGNWYVALAGGTTGANAPNLFNPLLTQPFGAWRDGSADGSSGGVPWVFHSVAQTASTRDPETSGVSVTFSASSNAGVTQTIAVATGSYGTFERTIKTLNQNASNWFIPTGAGMTVAVPDGVSDIIKAPNSASVEVKQTGGGTLGLYALSGNSSPTNNNSGAYYWEFNTDSLLFQITTAGWDSGRGIRVLVDDVEVSVGTLWTTIAGSNANLFTLVSITGKSKMRNIKVFSLQGIRDIRINGNASMGFVKEAPIKILWVGDSISAGSAIAPAKQGMSWPTHVANLLGFKGVTLASNGGTGFSQPNGATYNYLNRLTESVHANSTPNNIVFSENVNKYDIVVLCVSGNDSGFISTSLADNMLATMRQARLLQPDALIIVHGIFHSTGAANNTTIDNLAQTIFARWNDSNSFYLRTDEGALGGRWITGTGRNANTFVAATGTSSMYVGDASDSTHPNDAGIQYIAKKTVEAIYNQFEL